MLGEFELSEEPREDVTKLKSKFIFCISARFVCWVLFSLSNFPSSIFFFFFFLLSNFSLLLFVNTFSNISNFKVEKRINFLNVAVAFRYHLKWNFLFLKAKFWKWCFNSFIDIERLFSSFVAITIDVFSAGSYIFLLIG